MGVGTDPGEFLRESLGWRLSRLPRLSDELSFGSRGRAEHAYRQSNLSLINPAPARLNRPMKDTIVREDVFQNRNIARV